MSDWFEVIDRGVIVFAGPLRACETFAGENCPAAFIRPISF